METNDNELLQAVLRGNNNAFRDVIHRHMGAVYAFVYRYVRNTHDAEDVTQEAFVRVWKNLKQFDQSRNFKTWLFAIAKNAALDLIKKKKPVLFSQISENEDILDALLAPHVGAAEPADVVLEQKLARADLARALAALPPAYRTVLTMRYKNDLKFREIAEALGEPIDTVKSKHRRGLALLRDLMVDHGSRSSFA